MYRIYLLAKVIVLLLLAQRPLVGQETLTTGAWPAGVVARDTLSSERAYNYNFSEVEVSQLESWLKWLGYELPAKFSGKVSGWLWAQRSASGWFDVAGYRLEGEVESPQLFIESWKLEQARLRFGYADGVWYVGRLTGRVAEGSNGQSIGQADLVARLPLAEPRILNISGSITQVQLQPLFDAFDVEVAIKNQLGKLAVRGEVPLRSIDDIASWSFNGELDIAGIEFPDAADIPQMDITSPVELDAGKWSMAGAHVVVAEQVLQVEAQGEIARGASGTLRDAQLPYSAIFASEPVDLVKLLAAFRNMPADQQAIQAIEGIASLSGEVSGSVAQGLAVGEATLRSLQIMVAGEKLGDVELLAKLQIAEGTPLGLAVDLKSVRVADGAVHGQLVWPQFAKIGQGLPTRAELNIEHLDLSRLQSYAIPFDSTGIADGQLRLRLDPHPPQLDWNGQLRLRVREFGMAGNAIGDVYLSASKASGDPQLELQLRDAQSTLSLHATGILEQRADKSILPMQLSSYALTGELRDYRARLALDKLLGPTFTSIPVAASGHFEFAAKTPNVSDKSTDYWPASGSLALEKLSVALPDHTLYLEDSLLNIRPDAFRLERFRLVGKQDLKQAQDQIAGQGQVVGSALFRRNTQGQHLLNLRVSDLDTAPYVAAYAPPELHGLAGQLQAEMRLQKSAEISSWASHWTGQLDGRFRDVTFREVPLSQLNFNGRLKPELLSLQIDGSLLGGELDAKLELPPQQFEAWLGGSGLVQSVSTATDNANNSDISLAATLQSIELERLMAMFFGPRMGAKYAGVADLKLKASSAANGTPSIEIIVDVPSFFFERRSLAQHLGGVVYYQDGSLFIKQLSGGIAGGRIDVVGSLQTGESGSLVGDLRFEAEQLQLPAMAAWVAPDDVEQFEGRFSYAGRVLIGDEIAFSGAARLRDARVMELPVQDLRSQLRILFSHNGRLHELSARNMHGTALGGMLDGEAHLHGDSGYELSSSIKIGNGKTDQLSRALGFEHIVGTGTFDAQANLKTNDGLKLNALAGPLQIDFRNGDAQSVPILSDLGRLLPVFQLGSTDIRSGRIEAQFGQGQLHLVGVTLSSEAFSVVGEGSASLTSGGLDINALISTGGSLNRQFTQSVTQELVAIALPQFAVLRELNDVIRNRTVYLHIGGSPSHPIIQPQVGPTLGRALLQNVSRRLLIATPPSAASQNN